MSTPALSPPQSLFSTGRLLLFATAAVGAVAIGRREAGGSLGLWFALAAIAIAIWHGAFDGAVAEEILQPRFGSNWKPAFYAAYLALGAGVLVLWWCAPVVALPAFLLYSALHFGTETERELSAAKLSAGLAAGFVPIAAGCHWWPQEVAGIFALMLRGSANAAAPLTALAGRVLWPAVALVLLGALAEHRSQRLRSCALLGIELLLFHGCSPVIAFAVFFCLWHTPEHLLSTSISRSGHFQSNLLLHHLRRGAIPWLASLVAVAAACWWGRHEVHRFAGTIFIALSALTVPHMALAELCRRSMRPSPKARTHFLTSERVVIR